MNNVDRFEIKHTSFLLRFMLTTVGSAVLSVENVFVHQRNQKAFSRLFY